MYFVPKSLRKKNLKDLSRNYDKKYLLGMFLIALGLAIALDTPQKKKL